MTLPVKPSPDEAHSLGKTARRLGRSKSDLARQTVHEHSPYSIGYNLFGMGELSDAPTDPLKKQIWEKLLVKRLNGSPLTQIQVP